MITQEFRVTTAPGRIAANIAKLLELFAAVQT
jgi:hypothetical protein